MIFQIGSALLDACVLSILAEEDTYGYVLTQKVQGILDVSESSLYPVLRRLQKDNSLTTYDQSFQGRNRRYYSITEQGRTKLNEYVNEWIGYKEKIDQFLLRGAGNE